MLENYQLSLALRFKIGILFEFKSFGVNLYLQWLNYTLDKGEDTE